MDLVEWLVEGDPAIRWQVQRDLCDAKPEDWRVEQAKVATEGWGKRLLELQADDGRWTGERGPRGYRGLYIPKWTSTTYTLILLRRLGLPPGNAGALEGCRALVEGSQWLEDGGIAPWSTKRTDVCVCGMVLAVLEWFEYDTDHREGLLEFLLAHQKGDGGWNCQDHSDVSSFHTTLSVLEGLQLRRVSHPDTRIDDAMTRGHEYLLERRLTQSLRTGAVVRADFLKMSFPPRWYYDFLKALDHLREATSPDPRAADAVALLRERRRKKDHTWPLQNTRSGEHHFLMEKGGAPSRWNTLRALRVLRWWES